MKYEERNTVSVIDGLHPYEKSLLIRLMEYLKAERMARNAKAWTEARIAECEQNIKEDKARLYGDEPLTEYDKAWLKNNIDHNEKVRVVALGYLVLRHEMDIKKARMCAEAVREKLKPFMTDEALEDFCQAEGGEDGE